jgi:threonine synthase
MHTAELPARGAVAPSSALRALPQHCKVCGAEFDAAPEAVCGSCLGPLEPMYPESRRLPGRAEIATRAHSMWRYREWLPFEGTPTLSQDTGFTPLVDAPRLADKLGVARLWIKNDAVSHPSLSFKDRVVASAINAAKALGIETIGCASTGNLANAVAAQAARAGMPAWIFIPDNLEQAKVLGTSVYNPNLVRVRGHYDDVNRLCAQVADRFGWGIVNVNLRGYYGEGSKTMGFEIAEQLGWRFPSAVVVPMAGGSLLTKLHKAFGEVRDAGLISDELPRLYGAQASGCAPITRLVESGGETIVPEIPNTIAKSIAIGNPADGVFAARAMRGTGGWSAAVSDERIVAAIRLLAETTGIFTETAGGATVAGALALAEQGRFGRDDEVVLCITGNGLKTLDAISGSIEDSPVIAPRVREVAALVEAASAA